MKTNAAQTKISYRIKAEQDQIPIRGNASAIDPETDAAIEKEIIARLDAGDVLARASVCVVASAGEFEGRACLGGCSYAYEADFRKGGYYEQMEEEAR